MATANIPLRPWVPRWLGLTVAFVILLSVMLLNGTYTGSSINISGALGMLSEDISMAYYAAAAGMAIAYPIVPLVRPIITTKTILLGDLLLQVALAWICARTQNVIVLTVCSFLIGVLKSFVMLELIIILRPFFSPSNVRSEFYAYFYPIVFGLGQMSMLLTAMLAYNYQWQYMYYLVIALLLLSMILVMICFRYGRRPIRIPFRDVDWPSFLLVSAALLTTLFTVTYGKVLDWFESSYIVVGFIAAPLLFWAFVARQKAVVKHGGKPLVNFVVLRSWKAIVSYFFMAIVMFFNLASTVISSYTTRVLGLDNIHTNMISLWAIPGYVVGAAICFWWFRAQIWRFRVLVFWGMAAFVVSFAIIYFSIRVDGTYEMLIIPTILKGIGMMMLLIAFGVFAVEDIDPKYMIHNTFFMISVRSCIAPAAGIAFFNYMLYRGQLFHTMILGQGLDLQNSMAASSYTQSLNSAIAGGHPMVEAEQIATQSLYSLVQAQSLVVSVKQIIGWMLVAALIIMIISRFTPFHKTLRVMLPRTGEDMA